MAETTMHGAICSSEAVILYTNTHTRIVILKCAVAKINQLCPYLQAAPHQGETEGYPLVYVPQVLGYALVHDHALHCALHHALYDVVPGALALVLAQEDKPQRRGLRRRKTVEAQSDVQGKG